MSRVPKALNERHERILLVLQGQGGKGNIADVRRAADVKAGDPYVKKLMKDGLLQRPARNSYELTPEGLAAADLLKGKFVSS